MPENLHVNNVYIVYIVSYITYIILYIIHVCVSIYIYTYIYIYIPLLITVHFIRLQKTQTWLFVSKMNTSFPLL